MNPPECSAIVIDNQTYALLEHVGMKEVYVVVKQANFSITIKSNVELQNPLVSCELYYDTEENNPVP